MTVKYDFSGLSIMVVDDNSFMTKIVGQIMNAMRISDVVGFVDPVEAFAHLVDWTPDLIIVDWVMDPVNGEEFVRMIRSSPGHVKYVPIIVLTGHATKQLVQKARLAGSDYSISKPVSLSHLYKAFEHLIRKDRVFFETPKYFGPDRRRKQRNFEAADRRHNAAEPIPTPHVE
ncbi:MAG: response regulator [Alphaproteobacteria bacterium]